MNYWKSVRIVEYVLLAISMLVLFGVMAYVVTTSISLLGVIVLLVMAFVAAHFITMVPISYLDQIAVNARLQKAGFTTEVKVENVVSHVATLFSFYISEQKYSLSTPTGFAVVYLESYGNISLTMLSHDQGKSDQDLLIVSEPSFWHRDHSFRVFKRTTTL